MIFLQNDDFKIPFNKKTIQEKFTLPYCITNHSVQGMTIDEKYCIFDPHGCHVNLKWLYVAISRCTNLDDVHFFIGSLKTEKIKMNDRKLQYKIDMYKKQDLTAGREIIENEYITIEWIQEQFKKQKSCCSRCHDEIDLYSENDNKLTVDRLNNYFCHAKSNCDLKCLNCNVATKYDH